MRTSQYLLLPRNRRFIGCEAKLQALTQKLLVTRECQRVALVGLGGVGKTQIALEFAYQVKETRPEFSIFWVAALSAENFEQAYREIARKLQITQAAGDTEDVKELVKQHLSTETVGRWLLILDNADDTDLLFGSKESNGIDHYLPDSEDGLILFTTRHQEAAVALAVSDVIELEEMNRQEAATFLEKSLTREDLLNDHDVLTDILEELTYLPLAIAQAAAYLNQNKDDLYPGVLGTRHRDSQNAVATTWLVSFEQISKSDELATDILLFMSCIEPKAIPRSILPTVQPEARMESAIGTLSAYAFVVRRGDEKEYDLHRLVHLATRIWAEQKGRAVETATKTIQHMAEVFPSDDYANRDLWRDYLPHGLKLLRSEQIGDMPEKYNLCTKAGRCLQADGRLSEAMRWLEEAFRWTQYNLPEEDQTRLSSQHILAKAYLAEGQVAKAVELLEHVVAVRKRVLVHKHPNRLASQHELARAYQADGQVAKAVELLEHVVAVRERVEVEERPSRLASQHSLAAAYLADKQVAKAVELLEHVVAVRERVQIEEHPDRLASQHELAGAYLANNQVAEAVKLLEYVVVVNERVQVEEHPDRLASQHMLAGAYLANNQVAEAVKLLKHVVAVNEKVWVEEHPNRLASQHALAGAYLADNQVAKAVKLLKYVVAVNEKVWVEEHPSRLASQHMLARAYLADKQVAKALKLLEYVVAVEERVLVEEHPQRLASQEALAHLQVLLEVSNEASA